MAAEAYRVVFRGKLMEGFSRTEAETHLKNRFRYSDAALAKLFSGKGVVLKGGLDEALANRYKNALAGLGLVCEIQTGGGGAAGERVKEDVAPDWSPEPTPVTEPEPSFSAGQAFSAPEPPPEMFPISPPFSEPEAETVAEEEFWSTAPEGTEPETSWDTDAQAEADEEDIWAVSREEEGAEKTDAPSGDPDREAFDESSAADEDAFASEYTEEIFEPVTEPEAPPSPEPLPDVAAPLRPIPSARVNVMSAAILGSLEGTRPWVRLISILLFLSSGIGLVASLAILSQNLMSNGIGKYAGAPVALVSGMQILGSLLYLFPAYYLFKYASAIGALLETERVSELETALGFQKSFWKFSGVVALIGLILCVLGILAAILIPILIGYRG